MTDPGETPRLFYLWQDSQHVADGVQWPDGTVTVRWTVPEPTTEQWDDFDDPAAAIVHTEKVMVIWRRIDTYIDQTPAGEREPV